MKNLFYAIFIGIFAVTLLTSCGEEKQLDSSVVSVQQPPSLPVSSPESLESQGMSAWEQQWRETYWQTVVDHLDISQSLLEPNADDMVPRYLTLLYWREGHLPILILHHVDQTGAHPELVLEHNWVWSAERTDAKTLYAGMHPIVGVLESTGNPVRMLTSENEDGSVSERYFECNGRYPAEKLLYQILTYPNGEQAWTLYTDGENGTPAGEELSRPEDWPVVIKGNEVVLELTAPGEEYDEAACKEKIRQFLMDDLELSES